VRKITPFAVPGRCLSITNPATQTIVPGEGRLRKDAGQALGGFGHVKSVFSIFLIYLILTIILEQK
tara:strand:- start:1133 stop:1330 length:198 start_codon:yes stop_codon:yes gene_type:complete